MQESLKSTVMKIPLLTINAGPRFIKNRYCMAFYIIKKKRCQLDRQIKRRIHRLDQIHRT